MREVWGWLATAFTIISVVVFLMLIGYLSFIPRSFWGY